MGSWKSLFMACSGGGSYIGLSIRLPAPLSFVMQWHYCCMNSAISVRNKTIKRSMMLFPPCLHAFWHTIPTSFYVFNVLYYYICMCPWPGHISSIVNSTSVSLTKDLRVGWMGRMSPFPPWMKPWYIYTCMLVLFPRHMSLGMRSCT